MAKGFYRSLALGNLQKNRSLYMPYMLTGIGTVAMFYMIHAIAHNPGLTEMPGSGALIFLMDFGSQVIGIFSVIFLFYTNSFLMKRRKKELGLYNILGMEKRHIAVMFSYETFFTALTSIMLGLIFGIILSKLMFLILLKISGLEIPLTFEIPLASLRDTLLLFAGIYLLTLFANYRQIQVATPIALLQSGNVGEREPKTRKLLAFIGLVALLAGYAMAQLAEGVAMAVLLFWPAAILVILGTYLLFIATSIAFLKQLRKNKKYYYHTRHFIAVSGMLYRMKQNAVGLANICILSTAVLLSVSTTVALYTGMEDILQQRFPYALTVTVPYQAQGDTKGKLEQLAAEQQLAIQVEGQLHQMSLRTVKTGNIFDTSQDTGMNFSQMYLMPVEEYNQMTGSNIALAQDEALYYDADEQEALTAVELLGERFQIKESLTQYPSSALQTMPGTTAYYLVVADLSIMEKLYEKQQTVLENATRGIKEKISVSFPAGYQADKEYAYAASVHAAFENISVESREASRRDLRVFYGGFLFLGVFLGVLFLMATALIIYYKQISEGYEDQHRFEIMQKVGMSQQEVKQTISTQVLTVFFLPLVTAGMHIMFCFHIVSGILSQGFALTNVPLMAVCNLVTFLLFTLVYGLIYRVTAKSYYKIVQIR